MLSACVLGMVPASRHHLTTSFSSFPSLLSDVRLEEFLYEKLEKKAPTRMNNHELLGQSMIESGNEFSPGTAYG